jgi:CheY-like chemotaxis protein
MQRKKILFVESNPALATAISRRLETAGYQLILARNIAEALSKLVCRRPDISLIDTNLPNDDGFCLAQQIYSHPNSPGTPIVFIMADHCRARLERAIGYGPVAILHKPVDPSALITAIEQASYSTEEFARMPARKAA